MKAILQFGNALSPDTFHEVRRRAVFECCKWDPQVGDTATLAPFPLVLPITQWNEISASAERLAAETLAVESELAGRPELLSELGFKGTLRRALSRMKPGAVTEPVRVMRFDFHLTTEGWLISEVNSDVPGGFVESSGFSRLMLEHYSELNLAGDPVSAIVAAISKQVPDGGTIALVHATAYTDDRQVMVHLSQHLRTRGFVPVLAAPDHLVWNDDGAAIDQPWFRGKVDFIYRFFPAEWLPNLQRSSRWENYFQRHAIPQCNPAAALLTQNKRWPLLRHALITPTPEWQRRLPETLDPRQVDLNNANWVLKPALGRVGEGVTMHGATEQKQIQLAQRDARRHPDQWVVQRRFHAQAIMQEDTAQFACIGVYVIGGKAAGAYGRISSSQVIDHRARDVAVLVSPENPATPKRPEPVYHDTLPVV